MCCPARNTSVCTCSPATILAQYFSLSPGSANFSLAYAQYTESVSECLDGGRFTTVIDSAAALSIGLVEPGVSYLDRNYFYNTWDGFRTVFQMFTADSWSSGVTQDLLSQYAQYSTSWVVGYILIMLYMLMSVLVIANFFTGLIVDGIQKRMEKLEKEGDFTDAAPLSSLISTGAGGDSLRESGHLDQISVEPNSAFAAEDSASQSQKEVGTEDMTSLKEEVSCIKNEMKLLREDMSLILKHLSATDKTLMI